MILLVILYSVHDMRYTMQLLSVQVAAVAVQHTNYTKHYSTSHNSTILYNAVSGGDNITKKLTC